jgi:hypothetical protein
MNHQSIAIDGIDLEILVEEVRIAIHRAVEAPGVGALRAAEAGQVWSERRGRHSLEELLPVGGVGRVAVNEEGWNSLSTAIALEGADAGHIDSAGLDS